MSLLQYLLTLCLTPIGYILKAEKSDSLDSIQTSLTRGTMEITIHA